MTRVRGATGQVLLGLAAAGDVQMNATGLASPNVDGLPSNALFGEPNSHSIQLEVNVPVLAVTLRPTAAAAVGSGLLAAVVAPGTIAQLGDESLRRQGHRSSRTSGFLGLVLLDFSLAVLQVPDAASVLVVILSSSSSARVGVLHGNLSTPSMVMVGCRSFAVTEAVAALGQSGFPRQATMCDVWKCGCHIRHVHGSG
jgi:hypothetical protein